MSGAFAIWAMQAMIASALLMLAVLAARGPIRRSFGPQMAYALWALPLLRMVLPDMPKGWPQASAPIARVSESITVLIVDPDAPAAPLAILPDWIVLLLVSVWLGGAIVFLTVQAWRHHRFCRRVLADARPLARVNGTHVIASPAAPGPLAFGVWRRYVVFPDDFASLYDAEEQELALAHELGHHARADLLANWAALVVLALHWFSPVAWHAFHAFRADQEQANDARVLAGRDAAARAAYGRAIVKAADPAIWSGSVAATCHLHAIADLKGRLRMLTISHTSRRRLAAGAALVAVLTAGGLGLTASQSRAAAILTEEVGDVLQSAHVVPPTPATPTAPPEPSAAPVPTPPAPPAAAVNKRAKHLVTVTKNGKTTTYEGADADKFIAEQGLPVPPVLPLAATGKPFTFMIRRSPTSADGIAGTDRALKVAIPDVVHQACPGDTDHPIMENRVQKGHKVIVICINRMAAMQSKAALLTDRADLIERNARSSARSSLAFARMAITRDSSLSDDQRRDALAGITTAEAELKDSKAD